MQISRYLDHAILKPDMTQDEIRAAIELGLKYHVRTVCMQPRDVELAQAMCKNTDTDVIVVLDFPHGAAGADAKEALAKVYADKGVREIDMVMNYSAAKSGDWETVSDEIRRVVAAAHKKNVLVKVIFEAATLSVDQIKKGVLICVDAGADFVKTSTGFGFGGATEEAVRAMLEAADGKILVKPSGGIRDYATAKKYVDMGCARLGVGFSTTPILVEGQGAASEDY